MGAYSNIIFWYILRVLGDFEGEFWVKGLENHWKSTKKH